MSKSSFEPRQCLAILGGSFDPVHTGHVVIAKTMVDLLKPTQVRIIPSGWSWQKNPFQANSEHRLAMLLLAFKELAQETPLVIDQQEMKRAELGIASYSFDTLTHLRNEFGPSAALVFIMGADQLLQLQSWKNWEHLFDLAHIAVVSRPGFDLDSVDNMVAYEFKQRAGSLNELRTRAFGHTYLCSNLAIDISSTQIRNGANRAMMPPDVLDYIRRHQLYEAF